MPRHGVTREQVFAAADAIVEAGDQVTVARVRAQLGGTGSYSTLSRLLREWKRGHAPEHSQVELPDTIRQRLLELADAVWAALTRRSDRASERLRQESRQQFAQMQRELEILESRLAQTEARLQRLQAQEEALNRRLRRQEQSEPSE